MQIDAKGRRCDDNMRSEFPVDIHRSERQGPGIAFERHWHENFEILYFEEGEALIHCNSCQIPAGPGEIIVINSNDLHYGETVSQRLVYYVVEFDLSFLQSGQLDLCQTRYMTPLVQNRLLFHNRITEAKPLVREVRRLIREYHRQDLGYELAIKAYMYRILVLLLRLYGAQTLSESDKERQRKTLDRLSPVLSYMEKHYCQPVSLSRLAAMVSLSPHYFCRQFKEVTGLSPLGYLNQIRLNKAEALIKGGGVNITEAALAVGFNDSNYFSRLFKKYKHLPPSRLS